MVPAEIFDVAQVQNIFVDGVSGGLNDQQSRRFQEPSVAESGSR